MLIIDVPKGVKVAVFGDVHSHKEQFNKMIKAIQPSEKLWITSVGDWVDKGWSNKDAEEMIENFMKFASRNIGFSVRGNHDIKYIKAATKEELKTKKCLQWLNSCPLSYTFRFVNGSLLSILHGGVTPGMSATDIDNDSSVCYIRSVDEFGKSVPYIYKTKDGKKTMEPARVGVVWHEVYDGRLGYLACGHASRKDGIPKFYNFSCNLDSGIYVTGRLTVQIFSEKGKEDLLFFDGPARFKDANDFYKSMAIDEIKG